MMEIWKPVPGYEGIYEASNLGQVRSSDRIGVDGRRLHGRILSDKPNNQGYPICVLCKQGKYTKYQTHRIIAITFLSPDSENFTIHHKNGIRNDNRIENLEILTFSQHARYHLLHKPLNNSGNKNGQSKLTTEIVRMIRDEYAAGKVLQRELAARYNISRCHVSDIVNRKRWAHI